MSAENASKSMSKIALITGASRGLGRNTALSVARRGMDAIITYHSNRAEADNCIAAIKELGRKAVALQLDSGVVASFDDFVRAVSSALRANWSTDRFDFLVNNAGTAVAAPFAETKEADFDRLYNIHLKGVFFLTQKLLPLIRDGGRIINLSSGLARFTLPGYSAYSAMKGAIEVLTRYMAKELGPRGIRVNAVAPGAIVSGFMPLKSEISPLPLLRRLADAGARLALPAIAGRGKPLTMRAYAFGDEFARGQWGIREPKPEQPEVFPDVLIVPLACFDRAGHRIGYGAGYYDMTIHRLRGMKKVIAIGIAFAAQEIAKVPATERDERLDLVLTEREVIDFRRT